MVKIINAILILFALYMGIKQGWAMLSGKPQMVELFSKWNLEKTAMMVMGIVTISGAVLVLIPKTFLLGNFITASAILFIICLHLHHRDLKSVAIELPFFLMSWLIIYLQHPLREC
jgi:hypothetical protein